MINEKENNLRDSINELRKIRKLLINYGKLSIIEYTAKTTTYLFVAGISFSLGICSVICLCLGFSCILENHFTEETCYFLISSILICIILLIILSRKYMFTNPLVRKLSRKMFNNKSTIPNKQEV